MAKNKLNTPFDFIKAANPDTNIFKNPHTKQSPAPINSGFNTTVAGQTKTNNRSFDPRKYNKGVPSVNVRNIPKEFDESDRFETFTPDAIGTGQGQLMDPVCFLPEQLITMSDGSLKQIVKISVGESVKVYDIDKEKVLDSKVNRILKKEHKDVYSLTLSNNKILKPTGNHPFWTKDKGWTTIDGHNPNHGGGSDYLKVGDNVLDIKEGWVEVSSIEAVDGSYMTYSFLDMETGTIIADGIVTHNSGGGPEGEWLVEGEIPAEAASYTGQGQGWAPETYVGPNWHSNSSPHYESWWEQGGSWGEGGASANVPAGCDFYGPSCNNCPTGYTWSYIGYGGWSCINQNPGSEAASSGSDPDWYDENCDNDYDCCPTYDGDGNCVHCCDGIGGGTFGDETDEPTAEELCWTLLGECWDGSNCAPCEDDEDPPDIPDDDDDDAGGDNCMLQCIDGCMEPIDCGGQPNGTYYSPLPCCEHDGPNPDDDDDFNPCAPIGQCLDPDTYTCVPC